MNAILVTGAARRGGAAIARHIHARGHRVILHSRPAATAEAQAVADELNRLRRGSAMCWAAELNDSVALPPAAWRVAGIVANASAYRPSTLASFRDSLEDDMQTHVKGHLALIAHYRESLMECRGSVVAVTDMHVERPHKHYLTYQIAKGALDAAVKSLALELAPYVRVNAVAPGPLEWPLDQHVEPLHQKRVMATTPLARTGTFDELAKAVCFLLFDATFTTGSTLNVDGGRTIFSE